MPPPAIKHDPFNSDKAQMVDDILVPINQTYDYINDLKNPFFIRMYQVFQELYSNTTLLFHNKMPLTKQELNQFIQEMRLFDLQFNHVSSSNLTKFISDTAGTKYYKINLLIPNADRDTANTTTNANPNQLVTVYLAYHFSMSSVINSVIFAIMYFCKLFPGNYDQLTMYVVMSLDRRMFPHDKVLTPDRLRQAREQSVAFTCAALCDVENKKVIVSKYENIMSTIFHELMHYIDFDNHSKLSGIKLKQLKIKTQRPIRIYEVFVTAMSVVFSLFMQFFVMQVAFDPNMSIKFPSRESPLTHVLLDHLNQEVRYSIVLARHYIDLYDVTVAEFFSGSKLIDNQTPIIEYAILKAQFMMNIDWVFQIFNGNDMKNNLEYVDFAIPDQEFIDLLQLIPRGAYKLDNVSFNLFDFYCMMK
ncbi:Hypothetical protein MVR_LOCUS286 [uncultured virus]|nr:Hypothetical protein MVR_LOCUS286 [uncultured virus]